MFDSKRYRKYTLALWNILDVNESKIYKRWPRAMSSVNSGNLNISIIDEADIKNVQSLLSTSFVFYITGTIGSA